MKLFAALLAMAALLRTIAPPLLGHLKPKRDAKPEPRHAAAPVDDDPPVSSFIAGADEALAHGAASAASPQPPRTAKAESAAVPAKPKRTSKAKAAEPALPSFEETIDRVLHPVHGTLDNRLLRVRAYWLWDDVKDAPNSREAFFAALFASDMSREDQEAIVEALYTGA